MKLSKRILKNKLVQGLICWVAQIYIRIVYITGAWEIRGQQYSDALIKSKQPFIVAFWHGRLLMVPPFSPKGLKVNVVISNHNDGELIAKVIKHFGYGLIRGSSRKEGASALRGALRAINENEVVVITPDGPRGPRMRVGGTVSNIAHMSGVPILPITYSTSSAKIFRSWDRFMLAKPFAKNIFICGEPIYVSKSSDENVIKNTSIALEIALNNITRQADEFVGITPVEPEKL
jgi:lysophospholipid acyltransferase (LPLAT)-like uncharacterized protein